MFVHSNKVQNCRSEHSGVFLVLVTLSHLILVFFWSWWHCLISFWSFLLKQERYIYSGPGPVRSRYKMSATACCEGLMARHFSWHWLFQLHHQWWKLWDQQQRPYCEKLILDLKDLLRHWKLLSEAPILSNDYKNIILTMIAW